MNYTQIVNAALAYMDREDIQTLDNMNGFIAIFEARINRYIKTRSMSIRAQFQANGEEYYSLPYDFSGMRDIKIIGDFTEESIAPIPKSKMAALDSNNGDGSGKHFYCITADQFEVKPLVDGETIEIVYYQMVPPLTSEKSSNWLTDKYPDVYVMGICVEIATYMKDTDAIGLYNSRYKEARDEINIHDDNEVWSGPPMHVGVYNND